MKKIRSLKSGGGEINTNQLMSTTKSLNKSLKLHLSKGKLRREGIRTEVKGSEDLTTLRE